MKTLVAILFYAMSVQSAFAYQSEPNRPLDLMVKLAPILVKHQIKDDSGKLAAVIQMYKNTENYKHTSSFFWMKRHISEGVDTSYFDVSGIENDTQSSAELLLMADYSKIQYLDNDNTMSTKRRTFLKKIILKMDRNRTVTSVTVQEMMDLGQYQWDIKTGLLSAFALLGGMPSTDLSKDETTNYLISKNPMGDMDLTKRKVNEARAYYLKANDLHANFMMAPRN